MATAFIDYVKLYLRSGKGGAGAVHFRREKFVPKGGPDGGHGGRGGHVVVVARSNLNTLLHLKYRKHIYAEAGKPGGAGEQHGRAGADALIEVPVGTVIKDPHREEIEAELLQPGQRYQILAGGRGGKGNVFFKTATRQTPQIAQPGGDAEAAEKIFELRLLADVGLVGAPNVGKSTLLSAVSAARPKVGPYPFTTLFPQLGMVRHRDKSFVLADLPGLCVGAAQGKGLGIRFLRHIKRNHMLTFVLAADVDDFLAAYQMLEQELSHFDPQMLLKKKLLLITKIDLDPDFEERMAPLKRYLEAKKMPIVAISTHHNRGLDQLKQAWLELLGVSKVGF